MIKWRLGFFIVGVLAAVLFVWSVPATTSLAAAEGASPVAAEIDAEDVAGGHEAAGSEPDGHGATHGSTHPLSFDPDLAIFSAIIFLLMLVILGKFAWRPICDALNERERNIGKQISEAHRSNAEAQQLLADHEKRLANASEEVRALLDQARRDADAQKQSILGEAQQAAKAEKDRAVREIGAAKNEALRELADKSVGTAVDLAGRIVGRQLDQNDHAALIQDALKQFPSKN